MKKTLILLSLLLGVSMFFALVNEYGFAQSTATYTEISPATGATIVITGNIDDNQYAIPVPFAFLYDSNLVTAMAMSTNGYVSFNSGTASYGYTAISSTTVGAGAAAPMSRDLRGRADGELSYQVFGTSPNQYIVIQWKNWTAYGAAYVNDNWNFQVVLYETTNKIEYRYGFFNYVSTYANLAQVGLRGTSSADYKNRTTTTDWSATTGGAANNATCTISYLIYPPSDLVFEFTPPVATAPPNPATLVSPGNLAIDVPLNATLNWTTGGGGPTGYILSFGTVDPYAVIVNQQDMGLGTSFAPAMAYNTQYWWEVIAYNANGNAAPSAATFTTMDDPTILVCPWSEDFTDLAYGQIPNGWMRTDTHWGAALSSSALGTSPEMRFYWSPDVTDVFRLITPPINVGACDFVLTFKHMIDFYATPAAYKVQTSSDLVTWNDVWSVIDPSANVGPEVIQINFSQTGPFYIAWVFDGRSFNTDNWYVDDIMLECTCNVPVELSSFTATLTAQNFVQLTWVSQTESQMLGYLVYRSSSNEANTAEQVDSPLIQATNTSTTQTYSITDKDVEIGSTYYYWLEAIDYTSSAYHGPVSVIVEGNVPPVLPEVTSMRNAYPNPFKAAGSTNIEVALKAGETGTVSIYNITGQLVRSFSVNEGSHTIVWNGKDTRGANCGSGVYFYRLTTPSLNQTRKLVIVK